MANKFLDAQEQIEELKEEQKEITLKMGNAVAGAIIALGRDGRANAKSATNDISKLVMGLSDADKVNVLLSAIGKVIANM